MGAASSSEEDDYDPNDNKIVITAYEDRPMVIDVHIGPKVYVFSDGGREIPMYVRDLTADLLAWHNGLGIKYHSHFGSPPIAHIGLMTRNGTVNRLYIDTGLRTIDYSVGQLPDRIIGDINGICVWANSL